MRVYVKLLNNHRRALTIAQDTDIATLRRMVSDLGGMPPDTIELLHTDGRTLRDGHTAAHYALRAGDIIHETSGLWHWQESPAVDTTSL